MITSNSFRIILNFIAVLYPCSTHDSISFSASLTRSQLRSFIGATKCECPGRFVYVQYSFRYMACVDRGAYKALTYVFLLKWGNLSIQPDMTDPVRSGSFFQGSTHMSTPAVFSPPRYRLSRLDLSVATSSSVFVFS